MGKKGKTNLGKKWEVGKQEDSGHTQPLPRHQCTMEPRPHSPQLAGSTVPRSGQCCGRAVPQQQRRALLKGEVTVSSKRAPPPRNPPPPPPKGPQREDRSSSQASDPQAPERRVFIFFTFRSVLPAAAQRCGARCPAEAPRPGPPRSAVTC